MSSLKNIVNLGIKELRTLVQDPVMVIVILVAFTLMVYSAGKSVSTELQNTPIAVVDEDQSAISINIAEAFYEPHFKPAEQIALQDVNKSLDTGLYTFVLDIPHDFQKDLLAGRKPEIQLAIDATMMSQAFIGAGYISEIIDREVQHLLETNNATSSQAVRQIVRMRFNPNLNSAWFSGVMELINMITLLSVILTGAALIREREHGTLEHLLVMPITPVQIMVAKIWSMGLVVLITSTFSLYVVIQGWLNMTIAGSILLFQLGTACFLFSTTSLGILLGTLARSMPQLGLLLLLLILPLQMLSGGMTPFDSMPEIVQNIMQFAPTSHFVSTSQAVLYRGAGFSIIWPDLLANVAIGSVFFLFALALFRKSLASV
jgi:ABC-2 type transport system permease protein